MTWNRYPKVSPAPFPGELVGQTAAAAIAEISQGYFYQLCRGGKGPIELKTEDGKKGYDPTEVRAWGKAKPWLKKDRKEFKRQPLGLASKRFHLVIAVEHYKLLMQEAEKEGVPVSAIIRRRLS